MDRDSLASVTSPRRDDVPNDVTSYDVVTSPVRGSMTSDSVMGSPLRMKEYAHLTMNDSIMNGGDVFSPSTVSSHTSVFQQLGLKLKKAG